VASRAGAFEQAHKGTLLLDELGELSPALQVKLLRVVEDGCVRPVGGIEPLRVDVRIVSATCAPLAERIEAGRFRADLYHRLSTFVLRLPALRERKSDIPALARALLERLSDEIGPRRLGSSALARLVAHAWPGNVRELSSVLYRAAVAAETEEIVARHVDLALPARQKTALPLLTPDEALALLRQFRGNVSAASRAARVPRSTFRGWVDRALTRRAR
jgi:DNA-binding NtrC family response regulator